MEGGINTLEAALGFGAGCAFIVSVGWPFIVAPLRAAKEAAEKRERELMLRLIRKAGYDV